MNYLYSVPAHVRLALLFVLKKSLLLSKFSYKPISIVSRVYPAFYILTVLLAAFASPFNAAPAQAEQESAPAVSAGIEVEGEQAFVFVNNGGQKTRIVTDTAKALSGPFASNVTLAPDNKKLLFVSMSDSAEPEVTIWRVNIDGSERQALALFPLLRLWTAPFVWSPDSARIAYILQASTGQIELWRMSSEGADKERLLEQSATFRPEMFQGDNRNALKWSSEGNFLELTDRTSLPNHRHILDLTTFKVTSIDIATPAQAQTGPSRINLPLFTQTDPQWKNDYLGCGTTIGAQGCALTSTAMVFKYFGVNTNPKILKNCLGWNACPINWTGAGKACSEGKVTGGEIQSFDFGIAQAALARGLPVIVGFQVYSARTHFVVITGGSGTDAANYSVVDPWDASSTKNLQHFMSTLGWPNQMNIYSGTVPAAYTPAQGSSRLPAILDTYRRNGGQQAFGNPLNATHWWFGSVIQDFAGDPAAMMQDEALENNRGLAPGTCRAFAVRRGLFNWYTANGNPAVFGSPTSDEYASDGVPLQSFARGYIRMGPVPGFTPWPAAGTGWRAEYFNSTNTGCNPAWVTYEESLNLAHNWLSDSPPPALMKDSWSVRYTRDQNLAAGAYKFEGESDKEVRVWLDSQLIIERKPGQAGGAVNWSGQIEEGVHHLQVEYTGGAGILRLTLAQNSAPAMLTNITPTSGN